MYLVGGNVRELSFTLMSLLQWLYYLLTKTKKYFSSKHSSDEQLHKWYNAKFETLKQKSQAYRTGL